MTLADKIESMRGNLSVAYTKPSVEKQALLVENLKDNQSALDYLKVTRNLNQDTIDYFKLGYDIDKNAISIPVYKRGELINIRYRYIEPDKKVKYTQEKGCEVWLYHEQGLDTAKTKGGTLIVEGEFDLMSVWQAGIKNVVSPASGKESYGIWLELLDQIPKVYIAYDNDTPGRKAGMEMAERIGTDKSFELIYPEGIKDANDYFKQFAIEDYKKLIKEARPYYKYTFSGVADIISQLREKKEELLKLKTVPFIEFEEDWLVMLSGTSNIGKTSYALNIASELIDRKIPTLVLPYERGTKSVGKRFLQVRYKKTPGDFDYLNDEQWKELIEDAVDSPIYFSVPKIEETKEVIRKAKRLFNTKVVIVDHLNYLVRQSQQNENTETSRTLQEFKSLAQELGIIFIVVHHIRKPAVMGVGNKKPQMEDLKGSSSTYQDPEAVIMLSSPDKGQVEIDIVKNKGSMGSKIFPFNYSSGVIDFSREITDGVQVMSQDEGQKWFDNLPRQ